MTALPVCEDRVTAIVVNYRTPDLALHCVEALARERDVVPNLQIILVDGGSGDGSAETMRAGLAVAPHADIVTLLPLDLNGGFGWANNQAIRRALQRPDPADFIYLVNPDATIERGALKQLLEALRGQPTAGAAGSLLLTPDGRDLGSAFFFPSIASEFFRGCNTPLLERLCGFKPYASSADDPIEVDWVTGASVMLRASALRDAGCFDDCFFLYFEEVELMQRLAAQDWTTLHVPASRVRHIGGAATGVVDGASKPKRLPIYWFESRRRYFVRTGGPAYAIAASVAWASGYAIWRLRSLLGLGRASGHAPHECRDLLRAGLLATKLDRRTDVVPGSVPEERPPAWLEQSGSTLTSSDVSVAPH